MKAKAPKHVKIDSRCRVILYAYRTLDDAKIASEIARKQAEREAYLGFDYGFCTIGEIQEWDDLYWVTFP